MEMPRTHRQIAGCGLMNGPLGSVSTEMIMKKMKTPTSPVRTLLCQERELSLVKAV